MPLNAIPLDLSTVFTLVFVIVCGVWLHFRSRGREQPPLLRLFDYVIFPFWFLFWFWRLLLPRGSDRTKTQGDFWDWENL